MTKCHLCNVLHLEFIWQSLMVSVHQWKIPTHNMTLHHPNRFVSEVQPSGKPTLVWGYTLARPSLFFKLNSIYQRTIVFRCVNRIRLFRTFPFRQIFVIFVSQITWFRWNVRHGTSGVNVHNKNSNRYVPF